MLNNGFNDDFTDPMGYGSFIIMSHPDLWWQVVMGIN